MAEENTNVQGTETNTAQEPEKTFTQADIDRIISDRLARDRKNQPSEDEIEEFRSWKKTQKTNDKTITTLTADRDAARTQLAEAQNELEQLKREKYLTGKGVSTDDLDYYVFKIGKLVTDGKTFEQAAEDYLKENSPNKVRVEMTGRLNGGNTNTTPNDLMNALIRGK